VLLKCIVHPRYRPDFRSPSPRDSQEVLSNGE
jgi:hypothetical protein